MKINSEIKVEDMNVSPTCGKPTVVGSTVFNEDCMTVMARYPDGYFDIATCDIPYGIGVGKMAYLKEVKKTVRQKNGTKLNGNRNKEVYTQKEWDKEPPPQSYFDELRRVSKHQIIFGIDYVNWEGVGTGRIKWDKGVTDGMSFNRYETAYCSLIDDTWELPLLWAGMCQAKSLSEPMTQQGNKKLNEKRIHPCHKPVMLYDAIYLRFGFKGMKVIDTHLGGGSNRISCDKLNYEFVAAEIDKEYFDKQEKRFKQHTNKLKLWNY
jgi:site-specific DNA-methyltransferase (adenine-specific)